MKNAVRFAILAGLVLGLCFSAVAANAQTADPALVINAWLAAGNAHDVDARVASFTNDAVLNLPTGVLSSQDAIRAYLQGETTGHSNAALEQGTFQVNANRVSYRVSRSADNWRQLGIDALELNVEAVV